MPEPSKPTAQTTTATPTTSPSPAKGAEGSPAKTTVTTDKTPTASLSAYDELDALSQEEETAKTKPVTKEKPAAEDTDDLEKGAKEPEKEATDDEKPVKDGKTPAKEEAKPPRAAELRTAYENLKKRTKELETELQTVKTKATTPAEDPEKKALLTRLEEMETRHRELESKLQMADYASSQDYVDKYQKPIQKAFEQAYAEVIQLKIEDADGNQRAATSADFNALLQMPLAQAIQAAKAFGDASTEVLAHRRRILTMNQDRQQALDDAKAKHEGTLKEQTALQTQRRTWWQEENKAAEEKYTRWSKPAEDDPRETEILQKATDLADRALFNSNQMSPKEATKLHSAIYNKARWFDLLAYRAAKTEKTLQDKITELETKLAEYERSAPENESAHRKKSELKSNTWEDEIAELDR